MPKAKTKSRRAGKLPKAVAPKKKWTQLDLAAAEKIAAATNTPGMILALPLSALPKGVAGMPGAMSYFVSAYTAPRVVAPTITVGGEMAVLRTDAGLRKAYNYVFATSSDGKQYFNGPYKDFPEHHLAADEPIIYFVPFGHTPFSD
jgi:hypothetical protein